MDKTRNYGLLMPISCLPSGEGIGTMGEHAYRFIDFLTRSGAGIWQVLPLNPTNYGDSPYQSCCSDALNYYFIDLWFLVRDGLLTADEVKESELGYTDRRVSYGLQFTNKIALLRKAFERFDCSNKDFVQFIAEGKYSDFATFMALKCKFGHRAWEEWEEPYRTFNKSVTEKFIKDNHGEFLFWQFTQFIFLLQWNALKDYAHANGIQIMGDIPLYVAYDSVEMWKYGDKLFKVDKNRRPQCVAGVPPDAFTDDGQLWGNPVYDWKKMRRTGYKWWNGRINGCLNLFDILRIDHFRGFDRYYEIPVGEKTARNGSWSDGPKEDLFADKLDYNIVAEDLGVIDDGVRRLMKNVGYPGMKILEFAFDGSWDNEHKPSNYVNDNCVCYTGTHDNMPLRQYIDDLSEYWLEVYKKDLKDQCERLGFEAHTETSKEMCLSVVELAFRSKAKTVIIPLWDLLAMGEEARVNLPSTVSEKNWSWRFTENDLSKECSVLLNVLAEKSKRAS